MICTEPFSAFWKKCASLWAAFILPRSTQSTIAKQARNLAAWGTWQDLPPICLMKQIYLTAAQKAYGQALLESHLQSPVGTPTGTEHGNSQMHSLLLHLWPVNGSLHWGDPQKVLLVSHCSCSSPPDSSRTTSIIPCSRTKRRSMRPLSRSESLSRSKLLQITVIREGKLP